MGTHPIFESDFDCLTVMSELEADRTPHQLEQPPPPSSPTPSSNASSSDWAPRGQISPVAKMVRHMIEEDIDPRNFCDRIGIEIPDGTETMDIFRMLMRMLGGCRERRKRRSKLDLTATVELIRTAKKILILTGAGISVSCGIPDFRSRDGLYAKLAVDFPELPDPQSMFCLRFFRRDPRPFFRFAKEIFPGNFEPSPSHKFIAVLEKEEKLKRLYSQNIDGLEQQAGIDKVIQCHGHMHTAHCLECNKGYGIEELKEDILKSTVPKCQVKRPVDPCRDGIEVMPEPSSETAMKPCNGVIKPDIVFFGESLPKLFHRKMADDKDDVDLLIVMGSSLKVGPVNDIPDAIGDDVPRILINREPLSHISEFESELLGNCDEIVAYISRELGYTLPGVENDQPFTESNYEASVKSIIDAFTAEKAAEAVEKKPEEKPAEEDKVAKAISNPPSPKKPKLDGESDVTEAVKEESDSDDEDENVPIVRVDERHWMAHPCGYRTLFHGVEMPVISEDESSDDDEDNDDEETTRDEDKKEDEVETVNKDEDKP